MGEGQSARRFHLSDVAGTRLPRLPRRLRLGVVGGGRGAFIGEIHAMAVAIDARRRGVAVAPGLLDYPSVVDGARGVQFIEAAVESNKAGGAWVELTDELQ